MKSFIPQSEQIRLAEAVLVCMAHEQAIRPIVEAYEQEILNRHQFRIAACWLEHGCKDEVILDRQHTFLLSEADAKIYFAETFAARDAAGLKVDNPEFCPLLVAENMRIQAENALLDAMSKTPGLEKMGGGIWSLDLRARAIDLVLKLLAPFVADGKQILARMVGMEPEGVSV